MTPTPTNFSCFPFAPRSDFPSILSGFSLPISSGSSSHLRLLGCFRDRASRQRVFSTLFSRSHAPWWWSNSIIQSCAIAAAAKGYRIFSIQNIKECRWGPKAERDYAKYGYGWYCYRGLGWYDSGSVYKIIADSPGPGEWLRCNRWFLRYGIAAIPCWWTKAKDF